MKLAALLLVAGLVVLAFVLTVRYATTTGQGLFQKHTYEQLSGTPTR